jgi:hypothetical protein
MVRLRTALSRFNEKVAVFGTKWFGSMPVFWLFFAWGILGMLPFLPNSFKSLVLLISSAWIQLWALPLLAVGTAILNKASERRAKEDHETIRKQYAEIKEMQEGNRRLLEGNQELMKFMVKEDAEDIEENRRLDEILILLKEQKK